MSCSRSTRWGLALILVALMPRIAAADSPVADAAEQALWARVKSLVDQGANPRQAQVDGMTALHWAAYREDLATARLLLKAKANVNATNRYGVTPLSLSATSGNAAMVALLLEAGADANACLNGGESPLMTAARTGVIGSVRSLLAHGARVNAKDHRGQTAVMWAAAEGHADVVQALINANAEFREPLPSGFSPLCFAAREGRLEVVRVLLHAGADVNQAMNPTKRPSVRAAARGTSPLILAVENGHFELASALLIAGADPNDQRSGFTPLHTLTWVRKPNRGDEEDGDPPPSGSGSMTSLEFVDTLIEHGADVNARLERGPSGRGVLGRAGATPLMLAAMTADLPLMSRLIERGADPRITNRENSTTLMAAAGLGCLAPGETAGTEPEALQAVSLLIEHGLDVNAVDSNGETAMHGAAYKNFPRVVQLLADKGARIEVWNRKNRYGWTPLAIAEGHRPGNFKPSPETIAALEHVPSQGAESPPSHEPASGR